MKTKTKPTQRKKSLHSRRNQNDASDSSPAQKDHALPGIPPDALPFALAHRLLRDAGVPNMMGASSLLDAFHAGKLPGYRRKKTKGKIPGDFKSQIFFEPGPIYDLIGRQAAAGVAQTTVDQALVKYYEESPEHDPITALADKVAPTLTKAQQVFVDWHACKQNPFVLAAEAARKKAREAEAPPPPPPDPRCPRCLRTIEETRAADADVAAATTGDRARKNFNLAEEGLLGEFSDFRCRGCWSWLPDAPTEAMRARLLGAPGESADDKTVSATSRPAAGGKTADGAEDARAGARTEEVQPLSPPLPEDP